ncbi:MAG: glycosyltransferase [Eubacteriales bacterium]|nr:glycosyltransferase [Eubacteriales bacterium]
MDKQIIPIFYSCDDNFAKYTAVSLHSMICNASPAYRYNIHVLNSGLSDETHALLGALATDSFTVFFDDVTDYLRSIANRFPIRDYYSQSTYFRLFIADMFPQYDKIIYIDSDTIVQGDISQLYLTDIHDAYVGACHEQAMVQVDEYGEYAEKVIGVSRYNFFNAGLLLVNCDQFRLRFVLDKFIQHLHTYEFVVTQDEDYLNLICKDHVFWLDQRWNTEVFGEIGYPIEQANIVHYIMTNKPWHYEDCRYADLFWRCARELPVYDELLGIRAAYTDEQKEADRRSCEALLALAVSETNRDDNYQNRINKASRAKDRIDILQKIQDYERAGRFDEDVEEDPPSRVLMPEDVEYIRRGFNQKLKTKIAYALAKKFLARLLDEKKMIVKEIRGIEHFQNLTSGAVITCNHFNAYDSFAIQLAYEAANQPERTFYRIIREGNYTSYPGFYGFLMRNCNTLPLSSNYQTMKKLILSTNQLLQEGNFVLVYPEQSMWWNYRKPKPLKKGAYIFASQNQVPVLPCFITMKDSDVISDDGFFVQEYTIHIGAPIYPDPEKSYVKNTAAMMEANAALWKDIYEAEYHIPLTYLTE